MQFALLALDEVFSRIIYLVDTLDAGDVELATAIAQDLEVDLSVYVADAREAA